MVHLSSRSLNASLPRHTNRQPRVQALGNDEATDGPSPDEDGYGGRNDDGGYEQEQGDTDPEEGEEHGGAEGKGEGGEGEDGEGQNWEEGEEELGDEEGLDRKKKKSQQRSSKPRSSNPIEGWRRYGGVLETHKEDRPRLCEGGYVVVGALAGGRVDIAVDGAAGICVCICSLLVDGSADAAVVGVCGLGHGVRGSC